MKPDLRFRKRERLRKRSDYARVYAARRIASDGFLIVYVLENGLTWSRLGLSVGKRVGGAVRRNRIRRLIREAFRNNKGDLQSGLDIICVAKPAANTEMTMLARSLRNLVARAVRPHSPPTRASKSESASGKENTPSARPRIHRARPRGDSRRD